jgi:ribonuclease HII
MKPRPVVVRRDAGLYGYERTLARLGLAPVAGTDEAGRGACAGPLVVAAAVLRPGKSGEIPDLADSKLLTPNVRERVYDAVMARAAAWSVVVVPHTEVDHRGLHVTNVEAMRRALAKLDVTPGYVLTDGFPVNGLGVPGLAMWKGDQVAACIAAASVLAKVTRDRIMNELHEQWPEYDFANHKGYVTSEHQSALDALGPSPVHRRSYANVERVVRTHRASKVSPQGVAPTRLDPRERVQARERTGQ